MGPYTPETRGSLACSVASRRASRLANSPVNNPASRRASYVRWGRVALAGAVTAVLTGCATSQGTTSPAARPAAQILGVPIRYDLDGVTDDLLTTGLGPDGLRGPPPAFADPTRPTARELRRRAIYMNYRGLIDLSPGGGFGELFGAPAGTLIGGVEYLFAIRTRDGRGTTIGLLQIPRDFDPSAPCVIAVASSGSRGIYGALPTAGEWGLRHGCAVTHSDKGTGTGLFDWHRGRAIRIDGVVAEGEAPLLTFDPASSGEQLLEERPFSVSFKHAHSGLNVEAHWGEYLLQALDAGFQLLNREYPGLERPLAPENTLVIASGISNGGGTVLRALERDVAGWIDGAVVSEPNVGLMAPGAGLAIRSGEQTYEQLATPLFDYATQHMLLQPCAVLAEAESAASIQAAIATRRPSLEQWCADLHALDVLTEPNLTGQAREARQRLLDGGILQEALRTGYVNVLFSVWPAIAVTYASAYGRFAPDELPCGVSFAATDTNGQPRALTDEELARAFADSSGIPPTAGISLVAPTATGELRAANHASARLAACFRALRADPRIIDGQQAAAMTARTGGRPVIILHGRADALIPVNHASRAYYALNQREAGGNAEIRYYEVEHGQHFDAFLALPDLATRHVPLQPDLLRAMDLMAARLREGAGLPPSQVIRSRPRRMQNAGLEPLAPHHLGDLRSDPGTDAIMFDGETLHIPP